MSPSPATGLSKGEREREINSTSFGECKDVLRTCLVSRLVSRVGIAATLPRGAICGQGWFRRAKGDG